MMRTGSLAASSAPPKSRTEGVTREPQRRADTLNGEHAIDPGDLDERLLNRSPHRWFGAGHAYEIALTRDMMRDCIAAHAT